MTENTIGTHDDGLLAFMTVRHRLITIANRVLGNSTDAEDVVQDAWLRWQMADRASVRDAAAFLATTATRLAINTIQSAGSRRERHSGLRLLDPADTGADPERGLERREGLEAAIQLLLEKLSPTERAAYILREAFDYSYRNIADVLSLEEANARQVVTRARQHLNDHRRRGSIGTDQTHLCQAFIAAAHHGDISRLEDALCGQQLSSCGQDHSSGI